jgi:hypothetical protein
MRDALILAPVSMAILALIWVADLFLLGASRDLVERYLLLYIAAWIAAWLLGTLLLRLRMFPRNLSHRARCAVCILLFWPIHGIASAAAEEWTIAHRKATPTQASDLGVTYMYAEMSGMGYARGWADCPSKILRHTSAGLYAGVVWLPALMLSCYLWRPLLRESPPEGR